MSNSVPNFVYLTSYKTSDICAIDASMITSFFRHSHENYTILNYYINRHGYSGTICVRESTEEIKTIIEQLRKKENAENAERAEEIQTIIEQLRKKEVLEKTDNKKMVKIGYSVECLQEIYMLHPYDFSKNRHLVPGNIIFVESWNVDIINRYRSYFKII